MTDQLDRTDRKDLWTMIALILVLVGVTVATHASVSEGPPAMGWTGLGTAGVGCVVALALVVHSIREGSR